MHVAMRVYSLPTIQPLQAFVASLQRAVWLSEYAGPNISAASRSAPMRMLRCRM